MTDPREALVALLNSPEHAPMNTHDPRDGSCQSCPWPLHEMPPERIADAILAAGWTPPGEGEQLFERDDSCGYCSRVHSDFAACFEDAPVVLDSPHGMGCPPGCGHDRSEAAVPDSEDVRAYRIETERGKGTAIQIGGGRAGKTQALAERVADEVMKRGGSATVTSLPSVEDVARACGDPGSVTPRREGESVPRWSARAVLALLPGRSEAEVRQDEAERIAAWVTADEPSDTLVLLADALRRGDHRG